MVWAMMLSHAGKGWRLVGSARVVESEVYV